MIVAVTGAFGGGSNVGASDPSDGVLDVTIVPAATITRRRVAAAASMPELLDP